MKQLMVAYTAAINRHSSLPHISDALDKLEKHTLSHQLWPASAVKPEVTFVIAHHSDCLFLKYHVRENTIRATYLQPNDPVYEDSCVEFFVSFAGDDNYYNLEFNCLGTCRLGYGTSRNERQLLPADIIKLVKHSAVIQTTPPTIEPAFYTWQLTLMIPVEVFCKHRLFSLQKVTGRANFFKCGDALPEPHFLAWNKIDAPEPNFHLPEYFGELFFE